MATRSDPSFLRMCRAFPMRTALFTLGPFVVAVTQVLNAFVHGGKLWLVAIVAAATVVFSVLVTNYHLAKFRRRRLSSR